MATHRQIEYKDIRGEVKATGAGVLEGFLNVKNIVDLGSDVTRDGCFTRTVSEAYRRKAKGDPGLWPYLFGHDTNSIPLGMVTDSEENTRGLWIRAQLNLDLPKARELFSAVSQGAMRGQSMGYTTRNSRFTKIDGVSVRELLDVDIHEASSCLFPMNRESVVTSVKALKDFDSRYTAQMLDDWQYADFSDLTTALQQAVQDCFAPGSSPLDALERDILPGLAVALRTYVSNGIALGYAPSSSSMDMGMMSAGGKSGYLNADMHGTIKTATTNIMKHVRSIQRVSDALEAQRSRAHQGYPMAGASVPSDYFEEKEQEEAAHLQIRRIIASLEMDADMRAIREMTKEMNEMIRQ